MFNRSCSIKGIAPPTSVTLPPLQHHIHNGGSEKTVCGQYGIAFLQQVNKDNFLQELYQLQMRCKNLNVLFFHGANAQVI